MSLPKLQESLDRAMTRDLPSQDPPPQELSPSRDMSALMKQADRLREKGENHVGVHHLLLALLSDSKSSAASVLKSHGLTLAKVKATVAAIRKNRPTEKDEGEGEFENLKKYGEWRAGLRGEGRARAAEVWPLQVLGWRRGEGLTSFGCCCTHCLVVVAQASTCWRGRSRASSTR